MDALSSVMVAYAGFTLVKQIHLLAADAGGHK